MSQIFKAAVPNEIIKDLLVKIVVGDNNKYYLIDNSAFKKAQFIDCLGDFIETIKPYYHISKRFYLTRKLNYSRFVTIIRQICKHNEIPFTSHIKYDKSTYSINYYIYKDTLCIQ